MPLVFDDQFSVFQFECDPFDRMTPGAAGTARPGRGGLLSGLGGGVARLHGLPNARFAVRDFLRDPGPDRADLVLAMRVAEEGQ